MLLDRLLHWRSNHGYGVHSPFAFSFITTVLRDPGCAFYAYGRLGKLKFESRTIARLLLRTAATFNPREALIIGEATDSADAPLLLHDSRTRLVVSETVATSGIAPDKVTRAATFARALALYGERLDTAGAFPFIVAGGLTAGESSMLAGFIRSRRFRQAVVIFRQPRLTPGRTEIISAMHPHVMTFSDRRLTVAVSRPDLPSQNFRIGL